MDSIACWNVRGLNKATRQVDVKSLLISNKVFLVGLLETKISSQHKDRVVNAFNSWCMVANYDSDSYGRIWVLWKDAKCTVRCVEQSSQFMHCEVLLHDLKVLVNITFIYGFNDPEGRTALWTDLRRIGDTVSLPWLLLGDFNTTLFLDERIRGGVTVPADVGELSSFTEDMELMDMKATGQIFTWCNNQQNEDRMYCKLDRVLINRTCFNRFPLAEAIFLERSASDHSPSIVRFHDAVVRGRHIFRFCNYWISDSRFIDIVKQAWNIEIKGTPMYIIVQKLKRVKMQLKMLHRSDYARMSQRIEEKRNLLTELQRQVQSNPLSLELQQCEKRAFKEYNQLLDAETSLLRQKSKAEWLEQGDLNTKYFHARVKERLSRTRITSIQDSAGIIVTDANAISQVFLDYYKQLLDTKEQGLCSIDRAVFDRGPVVSEQQGIELCRPVSVEEVKEAVWDIPNSKSPGPDGFTAEFYRAAWDIIKVDVVAAIQDYFLNGKLLKQTNATLLTLVPKSRNPISAVDFRPIACCNIVYKIITKIITARLQPVLPGLIEQTQGAFLKKRSIIDNISICQGLVRNYHRNQGSPRCLMKLDLRKAYDTIDWVFIREVMQAFKFPEEFIQRVIECITSPSFSIMINGSPQGYFHSSRGLRQGDPMSPYLFVLAMDYFAKLLQKLHDSAAFKYHPKCKELKLIHLSFADDIMAFCKGDAVSPILLKEYIDRFANASGLKVNLQKSQVFFCGVNDLLKGILLRQLGFSEGMLPIKYLGLPLIASKLSLIDCEPIMERIRKKIGSWSAKLLSYAGRVILIKSVLFHFQVYWSNVVLLPKGVIKQIEGLYMRYLWSGSSSYSNKAMVAWERVCLPRKEGGLGILQIQAWNKAAFAKLLWKIIGNTDCL